jgi:hypothetical protein
VRRILLAANILITYLLKATAAEDAALVAAIVNYCLKRSIIMFVSTYSIFFDFI